jgi:general stress protein 26
MKHLKKSIWLTFVILILFSSFGFSQKSESSDSLKNELKIAAREIMNSVRNCALITLDAEGNPGVRTMEPFPPENDFTVWFGTGPKSRKVSQIKNNPNVTLYYVDNDESGYVAMHGIAQIVNDESEKEKRWKEEWKAYYQNRTDAYILIKVSPEWMEVISYSRGIVGNALTWDPPVIMFNSK